MSAYLVDPATIDVILDTLKAAVSQRPYFSRLYWRDEDKQPRFFDQEDARDPDKLTAIGQMLLRENVRSLNARYPDTRAEDGGGMIWHKPEEYVYNPTRKEIWLRPAATLHPVDGKRYDSTRQGAAITADAALKNLNCYDYQACESDNWEDTEAYRFCAALKERIGEIALRGEGDPWGWTNRDLGRGEGVAS